MEHAEAIQQITGGLIHLFGQHCPASADTLRCVGVIVESWFNWTEIKNPSAIGFQVAQVARMLQPIGDDEVCLNDLGDAVKLVQQIHAEYVADTFKAWGIRRDELRAATLAKVPASQMEKAKEKLNRLGL